MRLISCYIEKFGGLCQYSLEFGEGLTVIREPNGFGKTTLAEFLRAMFYGFPRKAKTLDKSRRQKYAPWSGGKCGGNLIFEHDGVHYRLERTFGATPRSDSFNLIDLETGKKSYRFSEEIGLELFQLDADSFERSTYLPQLHEGLTLTTNAIQAKLGDLVEDTGDINNYDRAVKTLKEKRSGFVPYRGSGGSVAAAAEQITRVQQELDQAARRKAELELCAAQIGELETELARKKTETEQNRKQWEQASKAEADRARYEDLTARHRSVTEQLRALETQYPAGLPEAAELDAAREAANDLAVLEARQVTTQADLDALRLLESGRARFENRIPDQAELDGARQRCGQHAALMTRRSGLGLSEAEQKQYETLQSGFESGALEEAKLDALAEQNRQLLRQRAALDSLALPEEDRRRMGELNALFPCGLPTEEEIDCQQQALVRCETLRRENAELEAQAAAPVRRKQNPLPILGAAAAALGVLLLVLRYHLPGGLALAAGIVLAAVGVVLLGKQKKEANAQLRAQIAANERRIAAMEASIREFTGGRTLDEIQRGREEAVSLTAKLRTLKEKRAALEAAAQDTESSLRRELASWLRQVTDFDKAISDLRLARGQYLDLRDKKTAAEVEISRLDGQIAALRAELTGFLGQYFDAVPQEHFAELLTALERDAADYVRAQEQTARWETRKAAHEAELEQRRAALAAFFARFGLNRELDARKQLQQMYDDLRLRENSVLYERQLAAQLKQLPDIPAVAVDADALMQKVRLLNEESEAMTETLLKLRQTRRELQAQADRIPELNDELERWQEQKTADYQKSRILDDTMDFLQQARERLTTSYLGPIRESFARYLARLTGTGEEKIIISSDLDVQVERLGQARELGYFSAGQTDTVMLCMRLALVDALFRGVKPFVILDDPFVNLDDERTAEALKLLQDLAEDRQIIYMTCSKSRTL